jgi:hypothetical protein
MHPRLADVTIHKGVRHAWIKKAVPNRHACRRSLSGCVDALLFVDADGPGALDKHTKAWRVP